MLSKKLKATALVLAFLGTSSVVHAGAIIVYGDTLLGINNEGHLNYVPTTEQANALIDGGYFTPAGPGSQFNGQSPDSIPFGLWRNGLGDSTSPGCLCEGWGVAVTLPDTSRIAGGANENFGGAFGITGGTFGSTTSTATSEVNLSDANVSVTHSFGPSLAQGVFQVSVTISNNTDSAVEDLVYRRAMDWDIPPTEFAEYVTHGGVEENLESNGGNVRYASDNGFASWDPRSAASSVNFETVNTDFVDNGAADHGSVFDFAFGSLDAGDSRTFNIFYGTTADEAEAVDAINMLGVDVYSLGQNSAGSSPDNGTPGTFLFAFGGVGGVELGSTSDVPVLPFVTAPGEFVFTSPESGLWYDPPYAEGFEYSLTGGGLFGEIMTPDSTFGFGNVEIYVGGVLVATLAPDEMFDLTSLNTDTFELFFVGKTLDVAAPGFATAFPLYLEWSGDPVELMMSALLVDDVSSVNAPASLSVMFLGCFAIFMVRRKTFRS
ncbi:hypothetical protein [Paraglaciecola sp.]|uniref:hypothetical protein n=1 Tax=Paraglaciecola sp. TaxID=1920173 RepID=UPI00273FAAC2|nr:hypothetical protein [Paraglaciecola sp.]MDP5032634.1 hypothetical protein [Paraglaciecola sp.]